ncbi:MAG: hypothetical protein KBG28_02810 [Kofleriaceae bacterium]|nr:hypothetical protein [Kofleriaceae bacterium]MBP6839154.1 hypothetical protein [Kofleriaceae bacterium]MBP9202889.1 hypothetical protein [Kofleriaceae bacterium]
MAGLAADAARFGAVAGAAFAFAFAFAATLTLAGAAFAFALVTFAFGFALAIGRQRSIARRGAGFCHAPPRRPAPSRPHV